MTTCSICLRETTPNRDRTGVMCDRSAPDGDPIQCVSVGQRSWQARAEELERKLSRLTTWHPASEPPSTDRRVLVWSAEWGDCIETDRWWGDRWAMMDGVTHWCELPPGPEVTP